MVNGTQYALTKHLNHASSLWLIESTYGSIFNHLNHASSLMVFSVHHLLWQHLVEINVNKTKDVEGFTEFLKIQRKH